jgi:outer membrane protein assembly factor BamB/precorrin-6B methylase 2
MLFRLTYLICCGLLMDGLAVAAARTGNGVDKSYVKIPAPDAPSLICFNKADGAAVWQDRSPGENILDGQWASPLVIESGGHAQVVTPQGDGWLRSFDALTGELIWKFDLNAKTAKHLLGGRGQRNNILAAPVYYDGRIYVSSGQYAEHGEGPGRLVCINPTKTGDISSELAVNAAGEPLPPRRIQAVLPDEGERAVANPNSGLVWEYTQSDRDGDGEFAFEEEFHRDYASVAIKDDLLMVGDFSGLVHCVDAKTGKVYWAYDCLAPIFAPPLIVGDKVYLADEDGEVAIFRLSPEPQEPLAAIDMGSSVFTAPIFAGGTLYVATRNTVFAIAAERAPQIESTNATRERTLRSIFVPTPQDVVEQMLELAEVKPIDVVYDLGSGDGRIVITAAKKYGCRAVGYEVDRDLVEISREKAKQAGVAGLVSFEAKDLFTADLSDADVIAVYLLPRQLEKLLPQFEKLKPGARIVSHHFEIPGAPPEKTIRVASQEDAEIHGLHRWTWPFAKASEQDRP